AHRDLVDDDLAGHGDRDAGQLVAVALGGRAREGLHGARADAVAAGLLPAQAGGDVQVAVAVRVSAGDLDVLDARVQGVVRGREIAAGVRRLAERVEVRPRRGGADGEVADRARAGQGVAAVLRDPDA